MTMVYLANVPSRTWATEAGILFHTPYGHVELWFPFVGEPQYAVVAPNVRDAFFAHMGDALDYASRLLKQTEMV
jgi:hypothetical protein